MIMEGYSILQPLFSSTWHKLCFYVGAESKNIKNFRSGRERCPPGL